MPPPRRILMVAHSMTLGGIERHVVALSAALSRAGHTVAFAGPRRGWMGEAMAAAGHEVLDLPMRGMYDAPSVWRLRRFARAWRADVIHGHALRGGRYAAWAARGLWPGRAARLPMLATAHSTNAFRWFGPGYPIIAVSAAVRDFLIGKGLAPDQLRLVHLGIPDPGLAPPRDPAPISAARPLGLGMLARLERVKGHDLTLEAAARLSGRLPLRLVLVGDDRTPWAAEVKARAAALGLTAITDFQGQRTDLPAILAQMDVLLAPSRREALSLTLIEAAAAGLPAIGARVGGIPEVIADERSGILVPPEDAEALAGAILRLADPALRAHMGAGGRAIFEAGFTEAAMVAGTLACYDAAMTGAGAGARR